MGPFRPYFPKLTSSSENRRKIFGKRRQGFGKGRQGKKEKKEGGVGGGWQERKKGGVGGVGGVSDDVIKKIKNKK